MMAFWRQFEMANPEERKKMLKVQVTEKNELKKLKKHFSEEVVQLMTNTVLHDQNWIKMRNGFYQSAEWKKFRLNWIETNKTCVKCHRGKEEVTLQVHHTGKYALDMTVMKEGFLESLKHPERFETMCRECHFNEHQGLVNFEKNI